MLTKPLVASVMFAAACVLSTTTAHAQSFLNPNSWYAATPTYAPAYAPAYCPNGNCAAPRNSYYAPAYSSYGQQYGSCPNGNCSKGACANGSCATGRSMMNGCPNGVCNGSARTTNFAPVSPAYQSYYRTPVTTNPGWSAANYRPLGYATPTNRMFNSANNPFYP